MLNVVAVKYYSEAEFWLASGKVLLVGTVFMFTFITMVGGSPEHDVYGFCYWNKPGTFAEYISTGCLGRSEGFLGALWSAACTVAGPEYVSMVAGERKCLRVYLKTAFKRNVLAVCRLLHVWRALRWHCYPVQGPHPCWDNQRNHVRSRYRCRFSICHCYEQPG